MDLSTQAHDQLLDPLEHHTIRLSLYHLQLRGLSKSATWLSQLLVAIRGVSFPSVSPSSSSPPAPILHVPDPDPLFLLARSYFETHQFQRAVFTLNQCQGPHATFLRLYARFLDAERQMEQERLEIPQTVDPINPRLRDIKDELLALRAVEGGLDPHLLYLLGVVLKKLECKEEAIEVLEACVRKFPYNWGAWLELVGVLESRERLLALNLGCHWMKTLFMAYYLNEAEAPGEARLIYEGLVQVLPKSNFFKAQLALALYNLRSFDEAQKLYDAIFEEDPYCLEGMDIYSNILYVKEDKVRLSLLANRCVKIDKFRLETCCVIGNYYSLRRDHEQAVSYFQRALKLNRNYLSAWTLMGHEFLEMKNTAAAVEAYRRAIDINTKDFRAWYGLGQTYELLDMPLFTLYYFQKAASLRPKDVRMWCAIGQAFESLSRQDEAIQCYERARACDDDDNTALAKLAFLYEKMANDASKDGRQQELAALYLERAAHYHLANLNRLEEEKRDGPETADALKFLAQHHFENNSIRLAEKFCYRLMNYPGHDKEFAKMMLRQIHSKDVHQ